MYRKLGQPWEEDTEPLVGTMSDTPHLCSNVSMYKGSEFWATDQVKFRASAARRNYVPSLGSPGQHEAEANNFDLLCVPTW